MSKEFGIGVAFSELKEENSWFFNSKIEGVLELLAISDEQTGTSLSSFILKNIKEEFSENNVKNIQSENEMKLFITNAFKKVESFYLESIDHLIAERAQILERISNLESQANQNHSNSISRLESLDKVIGNSASFVLTLIHKEILYTASVGDCRAILCRKDRSGAIRLTPLTVDHTTYSDEELQRLSSLGLNLYAKGSKINGRELTRCLGNFFVKGGYKEEESLLQATSEPVICEPHITSLAIDKSFCFLFFMNSKFHKCYQFAMPSSFVNKEIATMIIEQFLEKTSLSNVAQSVIDKVKKIGDQGFKTRNKNFFLVLRNFNFPLAKINMGASNAAFIQNQKLQNMKNHQHDKKRGQVAFNMERQILAKDLPTEMSIQLSSSSTESSKLSNPSLTQLTLDADGRILPYVFFDHYFKRLDEAVANNVIPKSQLDLLK